MDTLFSNENKKSIIKISKRKPASKKKKMKKKPNRTYTLFRPRVINLPRAIQPPKLLHYHFLSGFGTPNQNLNPPPQPMVDGNDNGNNENNTQSFFGGSAFYSDEEFNYNRFTLGNANNPLPSPIPPISEEDTRSTEGQFSLSRTPQQREDDETTDNRLLTYDQYQTLLSPDGALRDVNAILNQAEE